MVRDNIKQMNSGDGETSYAKNSGFQRSGISMTLSILDHTLENMMVDPCLSSKQCFKLVDIGCASGPNSLWVMDYIVDKISNIVRREKSSDFVPDFEVYLNDLPDNDFNNLFKFLPDLHGLQNGKGQGRCFLYALPSSFYERLFVERTLHFAYSSYSLHWLSQVPEGLNSENKENIYLAEESSTKVHEAYTKQFHRDFTTFLKLRAKEMIQGGRMVLSLSARSLESPCDDSISLTLLAKSLADMVIEGLVKREDLYSFNLPLHAPCIPEVDSVIQNEGSFTLDKIQDFRLPWIPNDSVNGEQEDCKRAKLVAHGIRSVMEPMMTKHFGSSIIDGLFERYEKKIEEHLFLNNKPAKFNIVISLKRN